MRTLLGTIAALLGAGLLVVSVGAYFVSTFCWEYCEPEDRVGGADRYRRAARGRAVLSAC